VEGSEGETAPAPLRRSVGGYELVRVLGSGGMGTVYEAIDADDRSVALKLLHPAFSSDDAARERLRREVATLHRVRGARVARVLDAEADADEAFIVTELIDGESLDYSVRQHGPLDAEELHDLANGLAGALAQIHAVGVVHRDMKPGNVMLTDDGPVVIDFGISQLADDARLTQTGLVTGTPGYVDPQVLAGGTPDARGDWWGWAAVLLFAATGRPPFGTGPLAAVLARVETGRADVDGLPPRVGQVLRRALHPDPELRLSPASAIKALDDHRCGREVTQVVALPDDDHAPRTRAQPLPPSYAPGVQHGWGAPVAQVAPVPQQHARPADQPPVHPEPVPQQSQPAPQQVEQRGDPSSPVGEWPAWAVPPRSRPGITLAWWLALVGAGMLWPGWALIAFGVVMVIGGTVGASARALRNRRIKHGLRRSDLAVASLASPAHAVLAMLMLLPGVLVGVLGGGILWGLLAPSGVDAFVMLVVVATLTLLVWWTPSSTTAREGIWAVLDSLAPSRVSVWIWIVTGLTVAAATAAAALSSPIPVWAPLPVPPIPSFVS
jgi:serine/threonine protein kinase